MLSYCLVMLIIFTISETICTFAISKGSFRITDNTFDLALSGDGFFALEFTNKAGETSTKYTRAGNFTLTNEGYLVNSDGDFVLDVNNRRIRLNPLSEADIQVICLTR